MGRKTKRCLYSPEGHRIEVYKKGKRHKVLVDTHTGRVVATNPLPLMALAAIPKIAGLVKKGVAAYKTVKGILPAGEEAPATSIAGPRVVTPRKSQFDKALLIEQLEGR